MFQVVPALKDPDTVAMVTAALLLVTALVGVWVELRKVHKVVNSRATEQDTRIAQLTAALTKAGVIVPDLPDE